MGLVQSLLSQASLTLHSIGTLSSAEVSKVFFEAVETGDIEHVADLLSSYEVDLAAIDDDNGQTALHRGISLGHDEIVSMLLKHAHNDSAVLDARDREQDTPLMLAVVKQNVALMKALIEAGASMDGSGELQKRVGDEVLPVLCAAQRLHAARGDISKAFQAAVTHFHEYEAQFFLEGGAQLLATLTELAQDGNHDAVGWMIRQKLVHAEDVLKVLADAMQLGNQNVQRTLTSPSVVLDTAVSMRGESSRAQIDLLRKFENATIFPVERKGVIFHLLDEIVERLPFSSGEKRNELIDVLSALSGMSICMDHAFIALAKQGDREGVKALFDSNVVPSFMPDYFQRNNHDQGLANLIVSVGLEKAVHDSKELPVETQIDNLSWIMDSHNATLVESLRDELKAGRLDGLAVLLAAKAPSVIKLLLELGETRNKAAVGKLIGLDEGVAAVSVMNDLIKKAKFDIGKGKHDDARRQQDVANELALALASHFLSRGPGNSQKRAQPGD